MAMMSLLACSVNRPVSHEMYSDEYQAFQLVAEKVVLYKREHGNFPATLCDANLNAYMEIPFLANVLESKRLLYKPGAKIAGAPILWYGGTSLNGMISQDSRISIFPTSNAR